jgi:hypothetical protein
MLLIKAQLVVGLHEFQVLGKAKRGSLTRVAVITIFGILNGWIGRYCTMPRGPAINSDLYLWSPKTLQNRFRSVGHTFVTAVLLRSFCNTTTHSHRQVLKDRKLSQNLDVLFFPTHRIAQVLRNQIYTFLEPSMLPSVGKRFGVMARLLKKWGSSLE